MSTQTDLLKIAQAEDLTDLCNHIAWTDVTKPGLEKLIVSYSKMLVAHLLGNPLPDGLTKEQLAGKIYGLQEAISLLERILRDGAKALTDFEERGFHIT
jgi:hypothetical protein